MRLAVFFLKNGGSWIWAAMTGHMHNSERVTIFVLFISHFIEQLNKESLFIEDFIQTHR